MGQKKSAMRTGTKDTAVASRATGLDGARASGQQNSRREDRCNSDLALTLSALNRPLFRRQS